MRLTCVECHRPYDTTDRQPSCPHALLLPREDLDRKLAAVQLATHPRLRFAEQRETGPDVAVRAITWNGMIELRGQRGEFDPARFVVLPENA